MAAQPDRGASGGQHGSGDLQIGRQLAVPVALVLPSAFAVIAGILVYRSQTGQPPKPGYYDAAAQIIPVLLVAFALEDRAHRFLSDPHLKLYRTQLFVFLLVGELFALLGSSGALRGARSIAEFEDGWVASSLTGVNIIAAGTTAGLVGGFVMIAVLAIGGQGWMTVVFGSRKGASSGNIETLTARIAALEAEKAAASSEEARL